MFLLRFFPAESVRSNAFNIESLQLLSLPFVMLYYFLKIVVGIFTRIFYCNPIVLNGGNIPQNVPLIIASNHPNALCDPCSIAVFSKQRINFLARGDVFRNKILNSIFVNLLGMVPIYRLIEGAENLHKNEETFRNSTEKLRQNKTILMFSEGLCIQERRLRKLKKGTARIAFASEEASNWTLGLKVIPVGLNYTNPKKFRSDFVINYGSPFEVSMFKELFLKDKAIAINEFIKHLEDKMAELVVHIADPENDQFVSQAEEILWNEYLAIKNKVEKFRLTKKIVNATNALQSDKPERMPALREKLTDYFRQLNAIKTDDQSIKNFEKFSLTNLIIDSCFVVMGFPLYIFGIVNNYLPYKIASFIADRIVKEKEFHASVNLNLSVFLYLVFYPMQIISVAVIFRNWWVLGAYLVLLAPSGLFILKYYESIKKTLFLWKFYFLQKNLQATIVHMRNEIITALKSNLKF